MSGFATIHEAFVASARAHAGRPLFEVAPTTARYFGTAPVTLTYSQVATLANRLRERYAAAGVAAGVRVALMLENRPEFFAHFLALNALGASTVPLHHELSAEEIAFRIAHSDARLVVALAPHLALARRACTASGASVAVVVPDDAVPRLELSPSPAPAPVAADGEREAALLYTSGSTGTPKGCVLSNEYFVRMGSWYLQAGGLCALTPAAERLVTPLPVSHMNALACSFMAMLMSGGCLVQLDRFHPTSWWQSVREARASIIHYLGVMPAMLLALPESKHEDFSRQIRFGFGAGVDPRHHERFEQRFGFPLIEGWAMTETGGGACIAATHEPRHVGMRCFGRAEPHVQYRLVDETGADALPGEPGELLVRSAAPTDARRGFFSGYLKDPAATEQAWRGGWFHTGDVVRVDAQGSFFFVDRSKNIVRRSGEGIAALEVENALVASPLVRLAAVAPVADDIRGEEVMACIVLADGTRGNREIAATIFDEARSRLAYFKAPGYIAFLDELPRTSSEKLQRGTLKQLCAELCARGEVYDFRERKKRPDKS